MITCDAHMHTRFSEDSDSSVHSMLDAAVNKGMQAVCITDHLDKDFPETPDFPAGAFMFDLDEYFSRLTQLKTEYQKDGIVYFVKSGRLQVRDFPEKWGIEPVIEVLCYEIGKLMGLNVAEQSLIGMEGIRYGKNFRTLVCSSPDFRNGKTLIYLASLYAEDESNIDFEKLCRNTGCGNDLINLLAFDLIIMNEDRHNSNVGFLMSDNGELKLSPIYDNGYSLLYDDIKGMLNDFKSAYRYCLCNAPLYEERFNAAERIFQKMSKIYVPTINLNIERNQVADRVMAVKKTYSELVYADINNIQLKDIWWEKIIDFIMWRIEYVRDLRDSVAE